MGSSPVCGKSVSWNWAKAGGGRSVWVVSGGGAVGSEGLGSDVNLGGGVLELGGGVVIER